MRRLARPGTRVSAAALLAAALVPALACAEEQDPSGPESGWTKTRERITTGFAVGFDAVVLRPLSAVHLLVGGVLFVPAAALSYFSEPDSLNQARQVFIDVPAENLFQRRLGDL